MFELKRLYKKEGLDMMFVGIIIIGVLIYVLIGGNFSSDTFQRKNASNHLDERLAKGEISTQEYKELKDVLKENR